VVAEGEDSTQRPCPGVRCAAWDSQTINKRIVQKRDDGDYEVIKPGADRASKVESTQKLAVDGARQILRNDGGGELQIRGLDGKIRQQDTIKPGNDPRSSKG
jgi:hypothetical protein